MSINVNTSVLKIGDKITVTTDRRSYEMTVWSISEPGTAGRAYRHGRWIHAWIRPGGYGVTFDYSTTTVTVDPAP